jgi:restriction endonuclease S subunit
VQGIAHTVKKEEIVESGDYSLSGEKYRKDLTVGIRESMERMTELLKPYQGMFDTFAKQAQAHQKQIEQIQESVQPFLRYVNEQQEMINELYAHLAEPIKQMQKAFESSAFKSAMEAAENVRKMVQGSQYPMVELGEVCELYRGVTYNKQDEVSENGLKVLRANNISLSQTLNLDDVKLINPNVAPDESKKLKKNDIFICLASGSKDHVGKVALITEDTDYYFGGFMGAVRVKPDVVLPQYLYAQLARGGFNEYLTNVIAGANINNLSAKILYAYKIPLPPLEVQKQIVDEIEKYQTIIDGANKVISNWQPSFDSDPDWDMVSLGEIAEINPKKSEIKEKDISVSFVPMECVNEHDSQFSPKEDRKLEEVYTGYTYFRDGDVLLAKVTPCFENGKAGIARKLTNGIGFGSSEFIVIRSSEKVLPEIIYYAISTNRFIDEGAKHMTGTGGLKRIPREFVESYKIPLPPMEMQKKIVGQVEQERKTLNALKELISSNETRIRGRILQLY